MTTSNLTVNPEIDFNAWMCDFIIFCTGMDEAGIYRGNQSREVLPATNEFCIYTPLLRKRRGTNVYSFDAEGCDDDTNGTETFTGSVEMDIQVDFYGPNASRYAQALETAAKSELPGRYFVENKVPLRVLGSTQPQDLTGLDASMQYVQRWTVTVYLQFDSSVSYNVPWFQDIHFRRAVKVIPPGGGEPVIVYKYGLVNVDVEFPPTEKNER